MKSRKPILGFTISALFLAWGLTQSNSQPQVVTPPTAKGVVFHDKNGNRQRDAGEPGLPDVKVSNGKEIVKTDAAGKYEIPIDDDTTIFVIKPRQWRTPINDAQLPITKSLAQHGRLNCFCTMTAPPPARLAEVADCQAADVARSGYEL